MRTTNRSLLALAAIIVAPLLAGAAHGQREVQAQGTLGVQGARPICEEAPPRRTADGRPTAEELDATRRRWERLTPEQRAQLAERYERFRAMAPEAREELRERAVNLEALEQRLCRRLTDEERLRLEVLSPARRAEVLGELVRNELETQGERLLWHLPEDLRDRFENASEEDRLLHFKRFKGAVRERMSLSALRTLARELELPREELQGLLALPGPARVEAALELGKRLGRREVEQGGLPAGLTLERWHEIEALPPADFYQEVVRLSGRPQPFGPPPDAEPNARRLREALRPSREQILEHADLPREERLRAIRVDQRPRLTELVRQSGLLTPAQMAELEAMPDGLFYAEIRRVARERGASGDPSRPHMGPRREGEAGHGAGPDGRPRHVGPGPRRPDTARPQSPPPRPGPEARPAPEHAPVRPPQRQQP